MRWGEDGPARAFVNGDVRPFAHSGLERILSMQVDGGFSYWPGGGKAHPWGTVYATHALVLGARQGYDVPAARLRSALDSVSALLRTEAPGTVRAYGTWVLSLAGRPEPGYVASLSRRTDLTPAARAFLVLAGGTPIPSSSTDSDTIFSGLETAVELLASPGRIDLARNLLASRRNGRWSKTVETAFAILALAGTMDPESGPVRVRTPFGNATLGPAFRHSGPARDFEIDSDGPVYWTLTARGPSTEARRLDRGIGIVREAPSEARAGETITVRLRLFARRRLEYVAIEDPLAAGFEPILGDSGSHAERRDDRVWIYADELSPGIHEFTYRLRATTPGTFGQPGARAEEMYRSEVFGTTAPGRVAIR